MANAVVCAKAVADSKAKPDVSKGEKLWEEAGYSILEYADRDKMGNQIKEVDRALNICVSFAVENESCILNYCQSRAPLSYRNMAKASDLM